MATLCYATTAYGRHGDYQQNSSEFFPIAPARYSSFSSQREESSLLSCGLHKRSHHLSFPRNGRPWVCASSVLNFVPDELPSQVGIAALTALLGFAALRAFIYFRMQYIIASMLGRHVPRGGSRVLDLDSHEGRNLYYYPDDVAEVVAIVDQKNVQVVKNQAIRAGVPVDVKVKSMNALRMPANSIDAVVSIYSLCDVKEEEVRAFLGEAIRLLKPGKPFIFVETTVAEQQFVRTWQALVESTLKLFGMRGVLARDMGKLIEEAEGLEKLQYELVFGYQDPHVVGVAMKQAQLLEATTKKKRKTKSISS